MAASYPVFKPVTSPDFQNGNERVGGNQVDNVQRLFHSPLVDPSNPFLADSIRAVSGLALVARGKERLQKLKREITNIAPTATVEPIQADLGSMTDIERLAAITLEACGGRLDILVNNGLFATP